ncbi:MAG: carbamoyl-phosphate synthase large subunit [Thermaerobacterales bacterium]
MTGGMDLAASPLRKVMVIGSGPIIIGQAAEFDYAGTQACRSLKELGLSVILLNSNPATIMTDLSMADRVYLEPLTLDMATDIIARERPDGLLPTLGGQVGLNLAVELAAAGVLEHYGVRLLGTPLSAIQAAEDREGFKTAMGAIHQPLPESAIGRTLQDARAFAEREGYPVVIRPAYTLGGTGGGFAHNLDQLETIAGRGLHLSPAGQVLMEKSVAGWKEVEFEVMRDASDTCIAVCGMENLDPCGVHTGDSIVVAPILTLPDRIVQKLRTASLDIIRHLGIEGGCNVQLAVQPETGDYVVIEVNPRVSRSSALASKATGYPIAKIAALIAAGQTLDTIRNPITGNTLAAFEPALDYVVVKIPRWPFDKFIIADRSLGTQMKATGEVMAIDRTFEAALLKAVRSLELGFDTFTAPEVMRLTDEELTDHLRLATDLRLFALAESLRRGMDIDTACRWTGIDPWFVGKIARIIALETAVKKGPLDAALLRSAKRSGLGDRQIARLIGRDAVSGEASVRELRLSLGVKNVYKTVDTCAAEFPAATPYFYSTYEDEDEALPTNRPKVLVLGSGPIRIGQGIEFDYCTVHAVWALRRAGYEAQIINNNPETVSTDFDTADRLFFEPLAFEDVMNVIDSQQPLGVITQFGGQTAINLAGPLAAAGVHLLGTPVAAIDAAEDRDKFDRLLARLEIPRPAGGVAASPAETSKLAGRIGYPVMVRPSYVLGGRGMEVVHSPADLARYVETAIRVAPEHPLWIDAFIPGCEVEVDAVCDRDTVMIPGIMEHVERAGIHSGDSTAVYPPRTLTAAAEGTLIDYTTRIALGLGVRGLVNIQFVIDHSGKVQVLEVNPRASRTVPFLSKMTGVPMVDLATRIMMGETLADMGWGPGLAPAARYFAVKMPVFSWSKLPDVDVSLGPEMKSTGEAIGIDTDYGRALYRAFLSSGYKVPRRGVLLVSMADRDKKESLPLMQRFSDLGFRLMATAGTAAMLSAHGLQVESVPKLNEGRPDLVDRIRSGHVDLLINTMTTGRRPHHDGFRIRRAATEHGVPCLTSLDTAAALLDGLAAVQATGGGALPDAQAAAIALPGRPLQDYLAGAGGAGEAGSADAAGPHAGARSNQTSP